MWLWSGVRFLRLLCGFGVAERFLLAQCWAPASLLGSGELWRDVFVRAVARVVDVKDRASAIWGDLFHVFGGKTDYPGGIIWLWRCI